MEEEGAIEPLIAEGLGAVLGSLAGIAGPEWAPAGAAGGVLVEQAVNRYWQWRQRRARRLADTLTDSGFTEDHLQSLLNSDRGALLIREAIDAAARSTSDEHLHALAAALQAAASGTPASFDLAQIAVELLGRLTDVDIAVLTRIRNEFPKFALAKIPDGIPPAIVSRLIGLGVLTFEGLTVFINDLGHLVLGEIGNAMSDQNGEQAKPRN